MRRLALAIVAVIVAVAGRTAAGWLGLSYLTMPVSGLGVAYVIGARVALTLPIRFRRSPRERRPRSNSADGRRTCPTNISGSAARSCGPRRASIMKRTRRRGAVAHPKNCPAQDRERSRATSCILRWSPRRLRIGVSNKPLTNTTHVTNGALYEAEGEIGIGKSLETQPGSRVTLDAEWLNVLDPPRPADWGPIPTGWTVVCARWLAKTTRSLRSRRDAGDCRAAVSRQTGKGRPDALSLVHFQSGPLQWTDWTNRLGCRALLYRLMPSRTPGDLAGCIGGPWAKMDQTDLALSFFEITPSGEFAAIR